MLRLWFVLCLVALSQFSAFLVTSAQDCSESGKTVRESYQSNVTGAHRFFSINLPPCYASTSDAYPLLLLLHGSNADDSQWLRLGVVTALEEKHALGEAPPMLVVMPFGDAVANQNRFESDSYDAVLLELLDLVDLRYRTTGKRLIGGISRGGFWAYHLGFRYPDKFVAVGGHSPFFNVEHAASAFNPLDLVATLPSETQLRLWLDHGSRDFATDGVARMHLQLRRQNLDHEYRVYAGGAHDEASWRTNIDDYVNFYIAALTEPVSPEETETFTPDEIELWLPAGSFAALRTSISREELVKFLGGTLSRQLVLSDSAAERLRQRGVAIHSETRIVAADRVEAILWRDKQSFTLVPFDELNLALRPLWLDDRPIVDQMDGYPLAWNSDTPNYAADRLTRITLSGTTALARGTLAALESIAIEEATSGIRNYVSASDFFHMTSEASIALRCPLFTDAVLGGANSLCMKRDHAAVFSNLAVDVIDLTGNHINDFGYAAFADMLDFFEGSGISIVGAGRRLQDAREPLFLDHNGNRIAWLACNEAGPYYALVNEDAEMLGGIRPGAVSCDPNWLQDALPVLATQVDLVMITVQYHEYESYTPTPQQRSDFRRLAEWGADVVIGTAEHKPMTFEFYPTRRGETAFIHYGLGNLFFDQPFWGNMRFFMDTLYIYDGQLLTVEIFPGIIDNLARPRLLRGDDQFNFLHFMMIQQNGY